MSATCDARATSGPSRGCRPPGVVVRSRAPLRSASPVAALTSAVPGDGGRRVLSATINRYACGSLRPRRTADLACTRWTSACRWTSTPRRAVLRRPSSTWSRRRSAGSAATRRLRPVPALRRAARLRAGLVLAMMVALVGLLSEYHRLPLTDYEVAELAYRLERVDLRHPRRVPGPVRGHVRRVQLHRVRRPGDRQPAADQLRSSTSSSSTCCCATPAPPAQSTQIIEDQVRRLAGGRASRWTACARRRSSRSR